MNHRHLKLFHGRAERGAGMRWVLKTMKSVTANTLCAFQTLQLSHPIAPFSTLCPLSSFFCPLVGPLRGKNLVIYPIHVFWHQPRLVPEHNNQMISDEWYLATIREEELLLRGKYLCLHLFCFLLCCFFVCFLISQMALYFRLCDKFVSTCYAGAFWCLQFQGEWSLFLCYSTSPHPLAHWRHKLWVKEACSRDRNPGKILGRPNMANLQFSLRKKWKRIFL